MPRRILLLITDLEIGGTPTVVRELALRLRASDHVEVACLKNAGPVAEQLRAAGMEVTAFDARRAWNLPRTVRALRQLIVTKRIDTVVSFLVHANAVAAIASRRLPGVRFIQSIQTVQAWPKWHWWVQGLIADRSDVILVPSDAVAFAAGERSGIAMKQFVVIPNAIAMGDFPQHRVFDRSHVRVGFLGRIDRVKRLEVAFNAVWQIRDLPAELHIFGEGPDRPMLEREQQKSFSDPRRSVFTWHGMVPTPQEALRQLDVLILPSHGEGFGLVLIEAMASGVPVVAANVGGIRSVIRSGYDGLLIDAGDDEAARFADAIGWLRDNPADRQALIDCARQTVSSRFTWDTVLPKYRKLLAID